MKSDQKKKLVGWLLAGVFLLGAAVTAFADHTVILEATGSSAGKATLELGADPLYAMRPILFRLSVVSPDGKDVLGAAVTCELTMPAMAMPENRPRVLSGDKGYSGELLFTMAGAWQATCEVDPAEGSRETFVFDIERVLLK